MVGLHELWLFQYFDKISAHLFVFLVPNTQSFNEVQDITDFQLLQLILFLNSDAYWVLQALHEVLTLVEAISTKFHQLKYLTQLKIIEIFLKIFLQHFHHFCVLKEHTHIFQEFTVIQNHFSAHEIKSVLNVLAQLS